MLKLVFKQKISNQMGVDFYQKDLHPNLLLHLLAK